MNLLGIRTEVRLLLDDTVAPYEISDTAIDARINAAEHEACLRADLLIDSTTAGLSTIAVVTGTNTYALDPLIIDIMRASLPSATKPLGKLGYKALDERDSSWQTNDATPDAYCLDLDTDKLVLSSVPIIDEALTITVSRLPNAALTADLDTPQIAPSYHYDLVYWVLHLTYNTRDSQIYDPSKATEHEAIFERRFGAKKTATHLQSKKLSYRRRAKAQWQ